MCLIREGQGEWGRQYLIDNGQGFFLGEKQESSDSGYKRIPKKRGEKMLYKFYLGFITFWA